MKKNILLLIDDLGSGGAQNQLTLLAQGLQRNQHNVFVFTFYPDTFFKYRLDQINITYLHYLKKTKLGLEVIQPLVNVIKNYDIDVVISFLDTPNFYGAVAATMTSRVKFIPSYRSMTNLLGMSFLKKMQYRFINKMASKIIANSHHERQRWQEADPANSHKWFTIYNCVEIIDPEQYLPATRHADFITVGSVGPAKNGLIVLEAMNKLKMKNIEIAIDWYGAHVTHLNSRKEYLDNMCKAIEMYSLSPAFTWCMPTKSIRTLYNNYSAMILASHIEGLPNVICEAMMQGLPCIVSNVLDHPLLIEDGVQGFLFDPYDADSLADAICRFQNCTIEQKRDMGFKAKQKALALFDQDTFINLYNNAILNC